jgi:hypothetical protein
MQSTECGRLTVNALPEAGRKEVELSSRE